MSIDTELRELLARVEGERDRAREECGHEKAMRAHLRGQLTTWIKLRQKERDRADAAEAKLAALREGVERLAEELHRVDVAMLAGNPGHVASMPVREAERRLRGLLDRDDPDPAAGREAGA